ncbi:preprotein translocase subunit SecA [Pelagibius sp.]|uniref:preprotein translocase subunit SecA n=1 Tax=Pelagibius sp. TaxID=1931238 RepID=UPI0026082F25|nr:preprotein translocase subunit SecA [Pelagibius sp.]
MFGALAKRLFGTANERFLKNLDSTVTAINALEPKLQEMDDETLKGQTAALRQRLEAGESLDDIIPDAFATVREAARRTLGQRHYDVQLIGGIVLHQGKIAEMKTGEGKTLVATLAVYLNALAGKGVHVVTVNDYLARRDAEWMGQIYRFLGLTVGCIVHGLSEEERRAAYAADVTYGTNNEFGFDYLRDNMKFRLEDMVQRDFNFAIVDEVDSILIDEARTPLIISGPAEDSSEAYIGVNKLIPNLVPDDFEKDEKARSVTFTETGAEHMEELLREAGMIQDGSLFDIQNVSLLHHANQALRAHQLFQRDTDYIVKDNKVVIIDEFTGRMMEGRRYSEGLHQALEAKEGVQIQQENQTLASITFQNYFRLYPKLAGMTGTAMTEATEFQETYSLEVIEIPTNVEVVRVDHDDEVYRTANEKHTAILEQIRDCQERKQPVLVGTVSIEKSEMLSGVLKKEKIKHQVLNARFHEQEAFIIAQAGVPGAVTIATNMAGRGTDIQLGGNVEMRISQEAADIQDEGARGKKIAKIEEEVAAAKQVALDAGGLYVISSERHESRRIDNQLRGRSGRQGDPGASKFFLSLEDDLMRIFGSDRMDSMLQKLGLQEGEAIVHAWVNKALEKAQQKVEARHFEGRKYLLKYDDVMNDQRKVVFEQRKDLMRAEDVRDTVTEMREEVIKSMVERCVPANAYSEQWQIDSLHEESMRLLGLDLPVKDWADEEGIADQEIHDRIAAAANQRMAAKTANFGPEMMRGLEKQILLLVLDRQWKDHLLSLDHLRQGVQLRAYGQRDPLIEYKREAFDLFENMLAEVREETISLLSRVELRPSADEVVVPRPEQEMHEGRQDVALVGAGAEAGPEGAQPGGQGQAAPSRQQPVASRAAAAQIDPSDPATWGRTPRNAPCPCGSGKKYKHCHGRLA